MELDLKKEISYIIGLQNEEEQKKAKEEFKEKVAKSYEINPELAEQKRLEFLYFLEAEVENLKNDLAEYQAEKAIKSKAA